MITRNRNLPRLFLVVLFITLAAGGAFAQHSWGDIIKSSQTFPMENWGGVGYGDVAEGFTSFAVDLDGTGPVTIEVVVTDVRQGASYTDDDSMLWLFDAEGYLIAENDDGPYEGYASLINGAEIQYPGRYYVVVTTHPNRPDTDSYGQFMELWDDGGSNISFELVVEWGVRDDVYYNDYDPYYGGADTEIWFGDFGDLAVPIRYTGGELYESGAVGDGVSLFRLSTSASQSVSISAQAAGGNYGDTVLFLMDSEGFPIAENDDGAGNGGSLIFDAFLERGQEYFVAVTTYPNWPNYNDMGYVEGFPLGGQEFIEFDLVVGPPQEYSYYEPYYGGAETAIWFDQFSSIANPIQYRGGEMVSDGVLDSDISVYRLTLDQPASVSVEVAPYSGYTDSVLYIFDQEGYLVAENDDGGIGGGSLVHDVYLDQMGGYFLAVVRYGSYPNIDEWGYLEGFPESLGERMDFELIIGPPREYDYGYYGGAETAIWFDQFSSIANPIHYRGGEMVSDGVLDSDISVYRLTLDQPASVSVEIAPYSGYTDSVLYIFDHEGYLVAENDDGGIGGGSLVHDVYLDQMGGYFLAVVRFGSYPNIDEWGYLEGFPESLGERMDFELIIGPPRDGGYGYYDDPFGQEPYPDDGIGANSLEEAAHFAQPVPIMNNRGIGAGEVGVGYAAFELEVDEPVYMTIEVVVTEVRQGISYADSDSMLSLFRADGRFVASDDDGGEGGASKIDGVWISEPGLYYAIVTTYPNEPSPGGAFPFIEAIGESNIAFDLVVRTDTAAQ